MLVVTRNQTSKLFGLVQGHIKEALHSLYLRDISSSDWQKNLAIKTPKIEIRAGKLLFFSHQLMI